MTSKEDIQLQEVVDVVTQHTWSQQDSNDCIVIYSRELRDKLYNIFNKDAGLSIPVYKYDDGKYQDEPVYDFEEMGNTIEDVVQDKLGKDVIVTISEVE